MGIKEQTQNQDYLKYLFFFYNILLRITSRKGDLMLTGELFKLSR